MIMGFNPGLTVALAALVGGAPSVACSYWVDSGFFGIVVVAAGGSGCAA
jgi:hypothetical protein